ncbi:membrane protein [Bacillus sp. M6-12]|uniref:YczE/YyaS/YitT family protein n=1 Tax=Bacillus sp. M6-12 TaxID=2054166 RepID=UPI000C766422|nr:membrane protein [Bacillus sp. M6-12]PLS14734.1 membrane protein [Bacillus sp. M6-12]
MKAVYRVSFFVIGIFILTFGVSLTIKAGIGTGAWDGLHVGLAELFGMTVGRWIMVTGILLMFLNAYLLKKIPEFLALGTIVIVGLSIDFWLLIVLPDWQPAGNLYRMGALATGIIILSFGICVYLQPQFPANPLDKLMVAIHKRFNISLMLAKTAGELIGLIFAFMVKGPIGIGTLIITFSIGPAVQWFYPPVEAFYKKLVKG